MICKICGKEFIRHNNSQKYCSKECYKVTQRKYQQSDEFKRYQKEYNKTYLQSDRGKFTRKNAEERYQKTNKCVVTRKEYQYKLKLKVIEYYSNGIMRCNCCGENHIEFLTIDHIDCGRLSHNKNKKLDKRGGISFYRYLIKNGFPNGYQVLCFNCNCSKGFLGECPHEKEKLNSNTSNI